jgi:heme exporter protein C
VAEHKLRFHPILSVKINGLAIGRKDGKSVTKPVDQRQLPFCQPAVIVAIMQSTLPSPAGSTTGSAKLSPRLEKVLGPLAVMLIVIALGLVFFVAPRAQDASGGQAQRIFYFHVPSAWIGFGAWVVSAYASVRYLRSRDMKWDRLAFASAEIGVVFIVLVLLSGMLWGRPTWNTWWTWDLKLTLSLLQALMYAAYLVLRGGIDEPEKRARFGSVYLILGVVMIPMNFLVSRVMQSIHPAVFGPSVNAAQQGGSGIQSSMTPILVFVLVAFTVVYAYFITRRVRLQEEIDQLDARRAALSEM